jgi:lipoic acid synthetase
MLRVRWLGRVAYADGLALQEGLHAHGRPDSHLLLLEHPAMYTLGVRARPEHMLVEPATVGADVVVVRRGGAVTYHGPGQVVGYPILEVPTGPGSAPGHVHAVEQVVIDALADVGLAGCGRLAGYPGVWVDPGGAVPRKICAVGVRITRDRSMHGFALNVDPDLAMFDLIVPCGIAGKDKAVTSLRAEGVAATVREVVDALATRAVARWGADRWERQDVAWRPRRPSPAGVTPPEAPAPAPTPGLSPQLRGRLSEAAVDTATAVAFTARKPDWLRVKADMGDGYRRLRHTMRSLDLVTVCEEAGCPNIFECWADGTATFMINGERCTRACAFCLVDTDKPEPVDGGEPERVAEAVERMGLAHAVVTAVARDDLADGGAGAFAGTIAAVRRRNPACTVETLVPDCKGDPTALGLLFRARPDILAHNVETVPRLQRAVRPSASYARSLAVLARAKAAGLVTKTSVIVGLGESEPEVLAVLADLRSVAVDIVTIGQYLRPSARHLPVARWWTPAELSALKAAGEALGIPHIEASPLTRSSYHARQSAAAVATATAAAGAGAGAR